MKIELAIKILFWARKTRVANPVGKFDSAKRWIPSAEEDGDNFTAGIRTPSRAWPFSYMVAARTRKHIAALAAVNPAFVRAQAALYADRYAAAQDAAALAA